MYKKYLFCRTWKSLTQASLAFAVLTVAVSAQPVPPATEVDRIRTELNELRERTEQLERALERIESTEGQPQVAPSPATPATAVPTAPSTPAAGGPLPPWSPGQTIPLLRAGPAYVNVSLSSLIDIGTSTTPDIESLESGAHGPVQRGFSLPAVELALDGAVDPYFQGFSSIALSLDDHNETEIELEEAYLLSSALPANLQLKAGYFFAEFGRHNQLHAHRWDFVEQPLVITRLLGPEGLRNPGARLSYLMPTPFYSELYLGVMNGAGETAFSFRSPGEADDAGIDRLFGRTVVDQELNSLDELLLVPRYAASFDLTSNQTLLLGTSGAFGANSTGDDANTQLFGIDTYWKWKSPRALQGFPFVAWQSEAMFRRLEAAQDPTAGLPSETLRDWGFYSQFLWGFHPRWVAALRGEHVTGDEGAFDDPLRTDRTRVSPNLTWYPSEFSKVRLQYNYDRGEELGTEHSIWLQLEFFLGAHGAHQF